MSDATITSTVIESNRGVTSCSGDASNLIDRDVSTEFYCNMGTGYETLTTYVVQLEIQFAEPTLVSKYQFVYAVQNLLSVDETLFRTDHNLFHSNFVGRSIYRGTVIGFRFAYQPPSVWYTVSQSIDRAALLDISGVTSSDLDAAGL